MENITSAHIQFWLKLKGLRQKDLAEIFGFTEATICKAIYNEDPEHELRDKIIDLVKPEEEDTEAPAPPAPEARP